MKPTEQILQHVNKPAEDIKITQCIGCHNEEDWIAPCIKAIYDEVDRIIVVEGAVQGRPAATERGHSTDKTFEILMDEDLDPDEKIEVVRLDRHFKTLEEQKTQFLNLANHGDWLLITDCDEIWKPEDIKRLRQAIKMYPHATEFIPIFLHFWGDTNVVKRYEPEWNICHQRFFRYQDGMRYLAHPTVTDAQGKDTCLSPEYQQHRYTIPDMYVYHYGYCKSLEFQKQKMEFYETELKKHNNAQIEHRQKYEEHQNGTFDPKSLLHFTGEHPKALNGHAILDYKYPHFDGYDKFDDWKSDWVYEQGARIPLVPNWMIGEKPPWPALYKELRFLTGELEVELKV